jgi:transposase-like protein
MNKGAHLEDAHWKDTGCEVAPSCLNCPLIRCKYDEALIHPSTLRFKERRLTAIRMTDEGKSRDEIAEALGVSRRSVYRALEGVR